MQTVNVIIPTYKPAEYLRLAIESALAQEDVHVDITVVDDASPETFQPLLSDLERSYPIQLLRRALNGGPAAAHNKGIAAARSEYLAFLEHDDLWAPAKLRKQLQALESHPSWGACYVGAINIGPDGAEINRPDLPFVIEDAVLPRLLQGNCIYSISSMVIRRECLEQVGSFDETFSVSLDYDLWLRIASSQRWQIGCVPEPLLQYRVHESNWSGRHEAQVVKEMWRALDKCVRARPDLRPLAATQYAWRCYTLAQLATKKLDFFSVFRWLIRGTRADLRLPIKYCLWLVGHVARWYQRN